ncbi:FecR family protein [Gabonibacter chumensis]|uniref:FecR family protein n=1 Tax=Gabonibacter chumensis TaxID=2972474 RepID=UPI00257244C4|nr:FecR family protein [Gabonibacter chumensis]MCR9011942.1 FecR domain-containing protein [Gabonibacter chumensis]
MTRKYIKIAELIYKQKNGIISEQEQKELDEWRQESVSNRTISDKLLKASDWAQKYERYKQVSESNAWSDLWQRISLRKRRTILKQMGYAAGIILLLGIGFYLQQHTKNRGNTPSVSSSVPGSGQAILYRANGENVLLTDTDIIITQNSISGNIKKIKNKLIYATDKNESKELWDTLETPNSCEFQVTLSDGTNVWLNARSRLTYPVAFVGATRTVRLEGEGYFEVRRDEKHPFIVEVNGMTIKVLGTSFNLKSFPEEGRTTATLMNGKIEISTRGKNIVLTPDMQADLTGEHLTIKRVDAESYRAWTKGNFVFRRERLESIMNDLARWYNMEVRYEEGTKEILFSGIMNRYETISETLLMIEKTGKVNFDITGSIVTVKKK